VLATFALVGPLVWWLLFLAIGELISPTSLASDIQFNDVFYRELILGFNRHAMLYLLSYALSWMVIVALVTGMAVTVTGASHSWSRAAMVGLTIGTICSAALAGAADGGSAPRVDLAMMNATAWLTATLVCWAIVRRWYEPERTPA
jgi:hypothetical protein